MNLFVVFFFFFLGRKGIFIKLSDIGKGIFFFQNNTNLQAISLDNTFSKLFNKLTSRLQ